MVAVSASQATNMIWKVGVSTASCDDCGMSNTFGALRMQVSYKYKVLSFPIFHVIIHWHHSQCEIRNYLFIFMIRYAIQEETVATLLN